MPWPSPWVAVPALTWAIFATSSPVWAVSTTGHSNVDNSTSFYSQLRACPAACLGKTPEDWTVYSSFERLSVCDQPMLFDLAINTPTNDSSKTVLIRSCTSTQFSRQKRDIIDNTKRDDFACPSTAVESQVHLQFARESAASNAANRDSLLRALDGMKVYIRNAAAVSDCAKDNDIMLSYYNGTVVGIYVGQALGKGTISSMIDELIRLSNKSDLPAASMLAQICDDERDMSHIAGLAVTATKDINFVQSALVSWAKGKCASKASNKEDTSVWSQNLVIRETPQQLSSEVRASKTAALPLTSTQHNSHVLMTAQAAGQYCTKREVISGDTCTSLAKACKILLENFYKYNNAGDGKDYCKKIQVGQNVCCSSGSLRPLPQEDGTCYTYTVKAGDDCSRIGMPWNLTPKDLAAFNDKTTWGWMGCSNLSIGLKICLSKGYPPMPAPISNAICGPQKPGTIAKGPINDASSLATLNPCPLNSCCNIWGQCGIDSQFCTKAAGPAGNPGTSPPGVYGRISNCGTDIVNNKQPPSGGYQRVGYYEAFNWDRPCLHMRADWSNTLGYTHMHWGFGDIASDLSIYVSDTHDQWQGFMSLEGVKKIVSFGGWGFSTELATYEILRKAMFPENRDRFVSNVVAFAERTGIDGIDIDWEYPGAPDIPGIPTGLPTDGPNYLDTLRALRKALPAKYSLSIAAPASYWYLRLIKYNIYYL